MRQAIVGLLVVLFGPLVLPVGKYFATPVPDSLMRVLALAILIAGWLIVGLSPTVYPWIRNPTQNPILSTLLVTFACGLIATLSWLLFAVKIASPDFIVSVFRGYYEPSILTFNADVAYINRSPIQRTVLGAVFTFHERGDNTTSAMYGTGIFGDVDTVHVDPGKTETRHYTQKIDPKHFNAIALTPSGKTKGEAEAGLQIATLNLEGIQQLKSVYFMSVYVDEGICQLGMFQGQKVSLNAPGDVFIK